MSDKISGKFHQIPSTIANQRWISILNIIIYLETKFRPNRRIFVFGGHFIPWLPWQWLPFWSFSTPPKAATYYGGYSYKVDHNMAPKPWISIPNIKIYLEINFFVFWQPLWIQNGHHSKPTMNINSQHHHHLHGNQISSKSEIFCIWRPICTLVTMATATILNVFKPPQKLPPTTVDIPTKLHAAWWKESIFFFKSHLFCFHGNWCKVCQTDSDFFWLISFH